MKSFLFNLLPGKAKEEVVKEQERDRSSVRSAILPLAAAVVWLALVLFNGLVVDKAKANWDAAIAQKENKIKVTYASTALQHGELVTKTKLLADVIQKDIKPEEVFILTGKLFPIPEAGIKVQGYGRETDGSFNVSLTASNFNQFATVIRRFVNYNGVNQVSSRSVVFDQKNNEVSGTINFFFNISALNTNG